jgi:hypothetical protein
VRPLRIAAGGLIPVLATGCAYTAATPSAQQQVIGLVHSAYQRTTALPAVTAAVTETVESGTVAVAQGKGTVTWEFPRETGETRLTVDGRTPVVAIRVKNIFYEGKTPESLAGTGQDLGRTGARDPGAMPQIQAPGLDPFQLTTLLDATSWPDCVMNSKPVVTSDAAGQHTEYQLGIDTAGLAAHKTAADRAWLTEMSHQAGGSVVALVATLVHGRISTLSARLPIPRPPSDAKTASAAGALPTPKPVTILVTEQFAYTKSPDPITTPS